MGWAGKAAMLRLSVTMSDGSVHNVSSTSAGGWTATTAANPVVYSHLFHVSITPLRCEDCWWLLL